MANNFRLTGDYYVSKKGNNANDGLTPETPLLTIQAALDKIGTSITKSIVIGSGVYKETLSKTTLSGNSITLFSDGKVILESFNSIDTHAFITSVSSTISFNGIEFRNCYSIRLYGTNTNYNFTCTFNNCIFKNTIISNESHVTFSYFTNCQFINSTIFGVVYYYGVFTANVSYVSVTKSIFINSSISGMTLAISALGNYATNNGLTTFGAKVFTNNYVDSNSLIQLFGCATSGRYDGYGQGATGPYGNIYNSTLTDSSTLILPSNITNNNIQGKLLFGWNGYSSGTATLNTPISLDQAKIDYAQWTQRSFSSDPLFNDVAALNFTLQSSSPHIKAATDYTNIGGTEYAVYKSANSTEFTTGATVTNLFLSTNSYRITSPNTSGNVQSGAIFLQWPRTKPLTKLEWVGSLDFNKSSSGGTNGNTNVPDWDTYTTGAGASPDRLTVRMRFSTQQTQPTTSSEWDNGGLWTAGNWGLFEINQKPKVDGNGRGNGDPLYVETSGLGDIVPSWVQFDVKLIDNYNP